MTLVYGLIIGYIIGAIAAYWVARYVYRIHEIKALTDGFHYGEEFAWKLQAYDECTDDREAPDEFNEIEEMVKEWRGKNQ